MALSLHDYSQDILEQGCSEKKKSVIFWKFKYIFQFKVTFQALQGE